MIRQPVRRVSILMAAVGRMAQLPKRKGAVLSMELVLAFPLAMGLFLALVQFSFLWVGNHRVAMAAREGCRVAILPGCDDKEIEQAVVQALGQRCMIEAHRSRFLRGKHGGDRVGVEVRVPMRAAAPDLLGFLGFGLGKRELVAQCVMRKQ